MYTNKYFIYFFLAFFLFSLLIMEDAKYPKPFDFKKGIDANILNSTFFNKKPEIIQEYEIEQIMQTAKDFIAEPLNEHDIISFETSMGTFKAKFFIDAAPNHCKNFKKLANSGFYDGTLFHRVIPGFMIQGGDILSRDGDRTNDGTGGPGWTIDAEFNSHTHRRGILSMARSKDPDSAGSQFFICVADNPSLDSNYTVFGELIENIGIIDHIVSVPTDADAAINDPTIDSGDVIPEGENPDNWVTIFYQGGNRLVYFKVPDYKEKNSFLSEMRLRMNSQNPVVPIKINKIRISPSNTR